MSLTTFQSAVVIEDHDVHARVAVHFLSKLGIASVHRAADGASGLELIQKVLPDLIVCDLDIPRIDGMGVLRRLPELSRLPSVLLVSAAGKDVLSAVEKLARVHQLDVIGVLEKPLSYAGLQSMLTGDDRRPDGSGIATQRTLSDRDLVTALEEDRFVAYFEPKIRRQDAQCIGAELLARMQAPDGSIIPPARFINQLERLQLIDLMTLRIFDKALACLQDWDSKGFLVGLSINISPQMLDDPTLPARLLAIASRHEIAAGRITLEIVETAEALGNGSSASSRLENLARLRLKGFLLSMDDFGTGYSSMVQISDIPITELKIDRQFCMASCKQSKARAICESGVTLAKQIGVKSCAEGIESEAIFNLLYDLGADTFQGYLFSMPLPADAFWSWAKKWNREVDLSELYNRPDSGI